MKYPGTAMQLDIWVWSSKDMFALEANMEATGPSIVSEVWEELTAARGLMQSDERLQWET